MINTPSNFIFLLILFTTSVLCVKYSYESSTTLFSPMGELLQVENAEIAGENGLPICVSESNDGKIIIVSKSNVDSKVLIDRRVTDKVNKIDKSIYVTFSGLLGDGLDIVRSLRKYCINYNVQYGCPPSVSNVARVIGDYQHKATLTAGERPYGIHTIVFGYDHNSNIKSNPPKIFKIKASGEVTRWKVVAIGKNYKKIMEKLEYEYKENLSTENLTSIILDKMLQLDKPFSDILNDAQTDKNVDDINTHSKNNYDVYVVSDAETKIYPNINDFRDINKDR